jgi:hypothetical protein
MSLVIGAWALAACRRATRAASVASAREMHEHYAARMVTGAPAAARTPSSGRMAGQEMAMALPGALRTRQNTLRSRIGALDDGAPDPPMPVLAKAPPERADGAPVPGARILSPAELEEIVGALARWTRAHPLQLGDLLALPSPSMAFGHARPVQRCTRSRAWMSRHLRRALIS